MKVFPAPVSRKAMTWRRVGGQRGPRVAGEHMRCPRNEHAVTLKGSLVPPRTAAHIIGLGHFQELHLVRPRLDLGSASLYSHGECRPFCTVGRHAVCGMAQWMPSGALILH